MTLVVGVCQIMSIQTASGIKNCQDCIMCKKIQEDIYMCQFNQDLNIANNIKNNNIHSDCPIAMSQ